MLAVFTYVSPSGAGGEKKPFNVNFSEDALIYSILNQLFCFASLTVAAGCFFFCFFFYRSTTSAHPQDEMRFFFIISCTHVEVVIMSSLSTHLKIWSIIGYKYCCTVIANL